MNKQAGVRRLYRGFLKNGGLARSVVVGTVTFATYDAAIRFIGFQQTAATGAVSSPSDDLAFLERGMQTLAP
jgi:cystathionine beta-lyase/cystathionine gamma-synthase